MSFESLNPFYSKVVSEPTLQQRVQSINSGEEIMNMTIEFSQEKGYSFISQEVENCLNVHSSNKDHGELKDEQLEAVSGGWFCYSNPSHFGCK